jgi:hypothetical protein
MRNELRFVSNALVYVADKEAKKEKEASLRDVSEHGLRIQSEDYIDIEPNSPYVIAIIPEKEKKKKKFQLEIESRWVKLNKSKMESGFSVIVPFDQKEFKNYLEYLAQKSKIDTSESEEGDSKL